MKREETRKRKRVLPYDSETRLKVVELAFRTSIQNAADTFGVSAQTVRTWKQTYLALGAKGLRQNAAPSYDKIQRRVTKIEKRLDALEKLLKDEKK